MADEDNTYPADSSKETQDKRQSSESWPWVNKLTGLVGLLATLATICFGAVQIVAKANADGTAEQAAARAAHDTEIAEAHRLEIAKMQIDDQRVSRLDQAVGDSKKRLFDRESAERIVARQEEQQERQELSTVITRMLTSTTSSEGDLAILSRFVNTSPVNDDIVTSAVVARLEHPRSAEEVDLSFHLLERLGVHALAATAQANRSARRHFEVCLGNYVLAGLDEPSLRTSATAAAKIGELTTSAAKLSLELDQVYVWSAVQASLTALGINVESPDVTSLRSRQARVRESSPNPDRCGTSMNTLIVERSNHALESELNQAMSTQKVQTHAVDLSGTYLSISLERYADMLLRMGPAVDDAYMTTAAVSTVRSGRLRGLALNTGLGKLTCSERETSLDGQSRWYFISFKEDAERFHFETRGKPFS